MPNLPTGCVLKCFWLPDIYCVFVFVVVYFSVYVCTHLRKSLILIKFKIFVPNTAAKRTVRTECSNKTEAVFTSKVGKHRATSKSRSQVEPMLSLLQQQYNTAQKELLPHVLWTAHNQNDGKAYDRAAKILKMCSHPLGISLALVYSLTTPILPPRCNSAAFLLHSKHL